MLRLSLRLPIALLVGVLVVLLSVDGVAFANPISSVLTQATPDVTVRTAFLILAKNAEGDLAVNCLPGEVATSGGGALGMGNSGAIGPGGVVNGYLTATGPFPGNVTKHPNSWHVIATNLSGTAQRLTVWVLCVK